MGTATDPRHETVFCPKTKRRQRSPGVARGDDEDVTTGLEIRQLPRLDGDHGNSEGMADSLRGGRLAVLY